MVLPGSVAVRQNGNGDPVGSFLSRFFRTHRSGVFVFVSRIGSEAVSVIQRAVATLPRRYVL